jgi:hypothetical protein
MKEALKATEDAFDHAVEIAEGIVAAACLKWSGNHRSPSHVQDAFDWYGILCIFYINPHIPIL